MGKVTIDGVEYEEIEDLGDFSSLNGDITLYLRPTPPKPKTIVQVAAEIVDCNERELRQYIGRFSCAVHDAIEQRLQAIEKKLEEK
jgi:hypothetical protein